MRHPPMFLSNQTKVSGLNKNNENSVRISIFNELPYMEMIANTK